MRVARGTTGAAVAASVLAALTGCGSDGDEGGRAAPSGEVEVFTWWAEGSEKEGLDALVAVFERQHPDLTFVDGAVAGGAGRDAKDVLASRLRSDDPPATFQAHAGAELTDYIERGQIEGLSQLYEEKGWDDLFPAGLLERLEQDGEIYSVPSNIHRANVVWANPAVLRESGLDPAATYGSLDEFIPALEKVEAAGRIPLSVATDWTQVHLLETVLLSELGVQAYQGLWEGETDWSSPEVTAALEQFATLLSMTNGDRQSLDWPGATQLVIDGEAAFNVMGDWAEAAFASQDKQLGTDYVTFPVPGTDGVFDFLADSFTMPVGSPNPAGTQAWLETVAGAEGQEAFNEAKGSIPANIEVDTSGFGEYQQTAIESWENDELASSLAHGAATSVSWLADITSAVTRYGSDNDVAALQGALVDAARRHDSP